MNGSSLRDTQPGSAESNAPAHTPGPWVSVSRDGTGSAAYIEACGPGRPKIGFANCIRVSDPMLWIETQEANARLMAAAPDLLRCAQMAVDTWDGLTEGEVRHHYGDDAADLVLNLRAAILKATTPGEAGAVGMKPLQAAECTKENTKEMGQ